MHYSSKPISNRIEGIVLFLIVGQMCVATGDETVTISTAQELWADFDPRRDPLEIEIAKSWDEGAVHFEQLYFTGETWQGTRVRVFAYRASPVQGEKLPGILHLHGGGQTASLEWVRYWASRGYVCVSHDFCGKAIGRAPELVTHWATAPAYMADPDGPRSSFLPNPRFNSWYHWILVARRALTLMEQHPQVDTGRLGVFGISVGGTLTWMVAGCDQRIAAAVPIYGVGQNTYTFPWQIVDEPVDENTRLTRALIEPEGYAAEVKCPLLFMNASNDHHGRLDMGMRTLAMATQSSMLREVYSPRQIHHIEQAEAQDLPLWMDYHLKGEGPAWPASPTIALHGGGEVPKVTIHVDRSENVRDVTIHYGLNNPWPTSRFYRAVTATEVSAADYSGPAPIVTDGDTIYAFANVAYHSGIQLSTRLIKVEARELPAVRPTLVRSMQIDSMDDDRRWFWWLAGTDPVNQQSLMKPWIGPHAERGFTHGPPGGFSFATLALSDPQFKSDGTQALLIDLWAESLPTLLDVSVATKFFEPGQVFYKYRPELVAGEDKWMTLKLRPSDFKDDRGEPLASWKDVTFLCYSGTAQGDSQSVFKNLRWDRL